MAAAAAVQNVLEYRYKSEENSGSTGNAAHGGKIVFAAPVIRIGGLSEVERKGAKSKCFQIVR